MPWQQVTRHISDHRIIVENQAGDTYPVDVAYQHLGDMVYRHLVNPDNDWRLWAYVEFTNDEPTTAEIRTGDPDGGPPTDTPV